MSINFSTIWEQTGGTTVPDAVGLGKGSSTAYDLLDPSNARKAISGLLPGGTISLPKGTPNIGFQSASGVGGATAAGDDDWRVRVSLSAKANIFYKDLTMPANSLLRPLAETNGVIFPYTPSITVTHAANYGSVPLTHSNYPAHFYNHSEVADITITGDFTVQTIADGQYLMAAVYFFRAATKMFFGQGANAGNPPPMVFLDGYGSHYFPHVPCVITSFSHTLPADADYIQIPITRSEIDTSPVDPNRAVQLSTEEQQYVPKLLQSSTQATTASTQQTVQTSRTKDIVSSTRVPTASSITVMLRPIYSRKNLYERFDLEQFAQGKLLQDKETGVGGFL